MKIDGPTPSAIEEFRIRGKLDRYDSLVLFGLALLVLATRWIFSGPVYFVDGPLLVAVIRIKWFVIQSPGYWLFAHLGGLFRDPATGLSFWTKTFSVLGSMALYVLCRMLGAKWTYAVLAALTYSFSYHVWFSGEIHSSYAAEILFPVLTLCCFLKLGERQTVLWAALAAVSAGLAIALRPSDGAFLAPLWLYLLLRKRYPAKVLASFGLVSLVTFFAWYLPSRHAMHRIGFQGADSQIMICLRAASVFVVGITPHSLANISRVYVPLIVAYWPVLPLLFAKRSHSANVLLALWTVPGLVFFTFGYMADPTYLVYLSGAFILAAVLQKNRKLMIGCLTVCLLWNVSIFMFARPSQSKAAHGLAWNFYVTKYCAYGIKHKWTETLGQAVPSGKIG